MQTLFGFVAHPSEPPDIGSVINTALDALRTTHQTLDLRSWEEHDIAGRFIVDPVLTDIEHADLLVADITRLNFNVLFEIGYAIAQDKRVYLIRNSALTSSDELIRNVGIFDTLGYEKYANSQELAASLARVSSIAPLNLNRRSINTASPIYIVLPRIKTDSEIRLVSRIKRARLQFRTYDPDEHGRLSAGDALDNVTASLGIVTPLLPAKRVDATIHNYRASFVAGLSMGLAKPLLLLQEGQDPVPLDYRDFVKTFSSQRHIDDHVAAFSTEVTAQFQAGTSPVVAEPRTFLAQLNLGASSAENELQDLDQYYLETDEYRRSLRGEVKIVTGRKGAGKTALFAQLRNRLRRNRRRIVLDLKPEGFQLIKFKERVLGYLEEGTREHTITTFWEYLLLLEICHKILQKDEAVHLRNQDLYRPYRDLADSYFNDEFVAEGDFAERMLKLTERIAHDFDAQFGDSTLQQTLTTGQISEILHKHDVVALRSQVIDYLSHKEGVWILFDNLDKGWPPHGVSQEDVVTLRCLIDAIQKVEKQLTRRQIECHGVVFIRNDVYELLVATTPDRGKVSHIALDWTNADLLRELLRRRFLRTEGIDPEASFDEIWRQVCETHIRGEETSQYMIDRCLMRPRGLIELLRFCKSHAVNLNHQRITVDDLDNGEETYSSEVLNNMGFEIRDVFPAAENVLYEFIDTPVDLSLKGIRGILRSAVDEKSADHLFDLLLWYGFLGLLRDTERVVYIYDVKYDMNRLSRFITIRASIVVLLRLEGLFMLPEFEERQVEHALNHELADPSWLVYVPGQVFESRLSIDAALWSENSVFWSMHRPGRTPPWAAGRRLTPGLWDLVEEDLHRYPPGFFNVFIQHKRPEHMTRSHSREWRFWNRPYYRFETKTHQQTTLARLQETIGEMGVVSYAAPVFHEMLVLWSHQQRGALVENFNFASPRLLESHRVYTYVQPGVHGRANPEPEDIDSLHPGELIQAARGSSRAVADPKEFIIASGELVRKAVIQDTGVLKKTFRELIEQEEMRRPSYLALAFLTILAFCFVYSVSWLLVDSDS
jgi:hypothetical protein